MAIEKVAQTRGCQLAKSKNSLEKWEVAIIKAMIKTGKYRDQEILAYFTRPNRTVNHARISEIRHNQKHKTVSACSDDRLLQFLKTWPQIDWETGLHLLGDQQLVKARESMMLAVQSYNNPKTFFRAEAFIVLAIIAWTYLLHAYFKSHGVDIRYKKKNSTGKLEVQKTKHGKDKLWELTRCLKETKCPLGQGVTNNLELLLEIRHEVEHQMTSMIDDDLAPKFLACCINFNTTIQTHFGKKYAMDEDFALALQFRAFDPDSLLETDGVKKAPSELTKAITKFESKLNKEEYADPEYSYRLLLVPKLAASKSSADKVIEIVKADSDEALEMNQVFFKETEKGKYKPKKIVDTMKAEGYKKFGLHSHTELWKMLDAKNASKGYGIELSDGQWYWYESWLNRVREHCKENAALYK